MQLGEGARVATSSNAQNAIPFLKWAGGKSLVADEIIKRLGKLPPDATYFEAFVGGGAVFFRYRPKRAVLIDRNSVAIHTYRMVKDSVDKLITELEKIPSPRTRREYEEIRTEFNQLPDTVSGSDALRRAALFVVLNHTCYNGLFRVNQSGEFNVPYGYYKRAFIFDPDNLRAASASLRGANTFLVAGDYSEVTQRAKRGDVAYFDPPYDPIDETANFTEYTSSGFGLRDQERLADHVHRLVDRGCRVAVSNSPTPSIRELYRDLRQDTVLVPRAINCDGTKRGRVAELLIYPRTRVTLHDQWEKVVESKRFDLDGTSLYEVTSAEVKRISGIEPRLVAKMDTRDELPSLLVRKNYFVLPVAARKYALVPGDGYHDLEDLDHKPEDFFPEREVPVTIALKAGESAAIQTALYSGLLENVVGVPQLRSTLHNDKLSLGQTRIHYRKDWEHEVKGAQVEVDAGFENHGKFFVFECKAWRQDELHDFNIRQLFFPQLKAREDLAERGLDFAVKCYFLNVDPDTSVYRFWEYDFEDPHDYASMVAVRSEAFHLVQPSRRNSTELLESLLQAEPSDTDYIPQADDASKLVTLLQGVAEGFDTSSQVARRFQFDPRQSSYYAEAAEELGLLVRFRDSGYSLTDIGSQIARLDSDKASDQIVRRIFTLPVFHDIGLKAVKDRSPALEASDLVPLVWKNGKGRYNETTVRRRTQSVIAWLNWIGELTGTIRVRAKSPPQPKVRRLDSYA
jgi:DNA adenine methylase